MLFCVVAFLQRRFFALKFIIHLFYIVVNSKIAQQIKVRLIFPTGARTFRPAERSLSVVSSQRCGENDPAFCEEEEFTIPCFSAYIRERSILISSLSASPSENAVAPPAAVPSFRAYP